MLLDDFTNDLRGIVDDLRRALELEKQAVKFWVLSLRNPIDVGCSHKLVIYELYTLDRGSRVQDLCQHIYALRGVFPPRVRRHSHRELPRLRRGHLGTGRLLHLWAVEVRDGS